MEHNIPCQTLSFVEKKLNKMLRNWHLKVHLAKPTYNTVQPLGLLPIFVSTLVFNGGSYTSVSGRNKKEAEQLAARPVILSLPGDFGSLKILYEIIKSKRKHYAALDKVKDPSHSQPNIVHGGVKFGCSEITVSQEQEVRAAIVRYVVPKNAISPAASGMRPPHHELKRLRPDPAFEPAPFSIAFKQLVSEQPMVIDVGSSSSQKEEEEQEKG
ncbi:hypothetical protein NC653_011033 [Populus alba x Populus x berolinensis]|uniref:DRBM domain-containing protein n=2 Tax=Populus TaxID=3689 RepID=A0A4U5NMV2_POPAL|nr:hypothetical protein NC653_011033 [Populus alba x Populus x berolinensis]TKR84264.1 hypothetical protein D5086_0000259310 [Populus alba]